MHRGVFGGLTRPGQGVGVVGQGRLATGLAAQPEFVIAQHIDHGLAQTREPADRCHRIGMDVAGCHDHVTGRHGVAPQVVPPGLQVQVRQDVQTGRAHALENSGNGCFPARYDATEPSTCSHFHPLPHMPTG